MCGPSGRRRAVRNGCDTSVFRLADRAEARTALGLDTESEVVVFVGRIAAIKGLRELVAAVMRLRVSHPRLQLFCIGEGALQAELEAGAIDADLADRIHFLGQRDSLEVASWLAASNVFCLPSYAEGCPNSVIEALACGRPVVATNVGGIPELVDSESGILVAPRDSERAGRGSRRGIVATLGRIVDSSAVSARVGPGCRRNLPNLHGLPPTPRSDG